MCYQLALFSPARDRAMPHNNVGILAPQGNEVSMVDMEWIDRKCLAPKSEKGLKILAFGAGYVFECEYDGEHWCNLGGDDFTHWMPHPGSPFQNT